MAAIASPAAPLGVPAHSVPCPVWLCGHQASDVVTDSDVGGGGGAEDLDSAVFSAPDRAFLAPGLGYSKVTPALGFAWANAVNTRYV